ncbi:E3 ubiquitin-protein ligase MARCH8 [Eumeta japonica]|uniref:E3 ubiquitin-protein ligase MARCH8 n=1 Tax=Eumeta variegata TaxID=151549 RepID=A0A4C1XZP5_EUMVA|nr:E3 ubiquitin-protein ligase MARCH8 [Eumeta japonica]
MDVLFVRQLAARSSPSAARSSRLHGLRGHRTATPQLAGEVFDPNHTFLTRFDCSQQWLTLHPVRWYSIGRCLVGMFRMIEFVRHTLWNVAVFYFDRAKSLTWPVSSEGLCMLEGAAERKNVETNSLVGSLSVSSQRDCWICYDGERAEPLIRPCRCTGDLSSVHHDCLRRWLVEVL